MTTPDNKPIPEPLETARRANSTTAEALARALSGRRSGSDWIARCLAHDDRSPSLSIGERDGRVLVHCHAGCDQARVIDALRARGLWPERERQPWTPAQRRDYVRARPHGQELARRAAWWLSARMAGIEDLKREIVEAGADPWDLAPVARELRKLQSLTTTGAVLAFRAAASAHPEQSEALVRAGRAWETVCRRAVEAVIEKLRLEQEQGVQSVAA